MSRTASSLPRVLGIFVMLSAWFVASNRCAFGTMVCRTEAAKVAVIHKCCPVNSGGEEQAPQKRKGDCCKRLQVVPGAADAKLVKAPDAMLLFELPWTSLAVAEEKAVAGGIRPTTGPPEWLSFAEAVLQRSVLSHAPPLTV